MFEKLQTCHRQRCIAAGKTTRVELTLYEAVLLANLLMFTEHHLARPLGDYIRKEFGMMSTEDELSIIK